MHTKVRKSWKIFGVSFLGILTLLLLLTGFFGPNVPVPSNLSMLVIGEYKSMIIHPRESITDTHELGSFIDLISTAPRRIVLPTLGPLAGPIVMINSDGQPCVAVFYLSDHNGLAFYYVEAVEDKYKITGPILCYGDVFQLIVKSDPFELLKGKWKPLAY